MKVIKIKVKTIILSIFIIFFMIPYLFYGVGYTIFQSINIGDSKAAYASAFLKMYEYYPTFKLDKGGTYYMLGMSNYNYIDEVLFYYGNGITVTNFKYGNMEQALIAKEYFTKGISLGEKDNDYGKNINALINLEMTLGNNEEAYRLILEAKKSNEELIYQIGLINEIVYYGKIGELDKALDLCKENEEYLPLLSKYKNAIYYLKGEVDKIDIINNTIYYSDEMREDEAEKDRKNNLLISSGVLKDIDFIEDVGMSFKTNNIDEVDFAELNGSFVIDGEPVRNTKVTIASEFYGLMLDTDGRPNFTTDNFKESQSVYTDENGDFTFKYVFPNENYELRVEAPAALVGESTRVENNIINLEAGESEYIEIVFNDKIKELETKMTDDELIISYEKFSSADSYGISIGVGGTIHTIGPILYGEDNTEIKLPLNNGSLQAFRIISVIDDEDYELTLLPDSYLGLIQGEEILIRIRAYNHEGKLISISDEVEVKLKKKELNYGEKLMLEVKEYETDNEIDTLKEKINEAYIWFKEKLEEDPNNTEYIYPTMRIAYEKGDRDYGDELYNRLIEIEDNEFVKKINKDYNYE